MAKLDAKDRKALPKSDFALPGERKFPVNDKSHSANAMARASEMVNKGKMSESTKDKIDAKADRKFGDKGMKSEKKEPKRMDDAKPKMVMDIKMMGKSHDPGSVADRQKDMKARVEKMRSDKSKK